VTHHNARDPWVDRLSEYLDDDLDAAERRQLERHLQTCARCRTALDELRGVVQRARDLAVEAEPDADLWPGVAVRLTAGAGPRWRRALLAAWAAVSNAGWPRLPGVDRGPRPVLAGLAALVLVSLVAGSAWRLWRPREASRPQVAQQVQPAAVSPPGEVVPPPAGTTTAPAAVSALLQPDERYNDTVADLRRVVRTHLTADPYLVSVLNRNLDSIDVAIADYRDALAKHPDDARLQGRLREARERKLEVLRQAASLAEGASN
jgi:hypothetical protein